MTTSSLKTPDGLLLVDKPAGITSHDVVARVRRLAHTRKVGHGGTLDPMATGVLVVAIGAATRLLTYLSGADKTYQATIRLGAMTVSDDADGEVTEAVGMTELPLGHLDNAIGDLTGTIMQVPSAVSAIKVNGKRSYARVRAGEDVKLAPREITVSRFERLSIPRPAQLETATGLVDVVDVDVEVDCSSGTYIRALARDLGHALHCGGYLRALRRTRVGYFPVQECLPLPTLEQVVAQGGTLPVTSLSEAASAMFPTIELDDEEAGIFSHGQAPRRYMDQLPSEGPIALRWHDTVMGLAQVKQGKLKTLAVFHQEGVQ